MLDSGDSAHSFFPEEFTSLTGEDRMALMFDRGVPLRASCQLATLPHGELVPSPLSG